MCKALIMGRPPVYTAELAEIILARLAGGESLSAICRDADMPSRPTVLSWVYNDTEGFFGQYARARKAQAEVLAEDTLAIADDGKNDWMERNDPENPGYQANGEHMQRSRLRVDTRKWYAARLHPEMFAEMQKREHSGPGGKPIQVEDSRKPLGDFMLEFEPGE